MRGKERWNIIFCSNYYLMLNRFVDHSWALHVLVSTWLYHRQFWKNPYFALFYHWVNVNAVHIERDLKGQVQVIIWHKWIQTFTVSITTLITSTTIFHRLVWLQEISIVFSWIVVHGDVNELWSILLIFRGYFSMCFEKRIDRSLATFLEVFVFYLRMHNDN